MTPIEYSRKLTGAAQGTYLLADHCSVGCFDNYIFHSYLPRAPLTPSGSPVRNGRAFTYHNRRAEAEGLPSL